MQLADVLARPAKSLKTVCAPRRAAPRWEPLWIMSQIRPASSAGKR